MITSLDKYEDKILTVGGGAVFAVRMIIRQVASVSQWCHWSHGQSSQIIVILIVKFSFVDSFFSCK